jgi:hypothetical protein
MDKPERWPLQEKCKRKCAWIAFINQLHAITYTMDVTSLRSFLGEDRQKLTAEGKTVREKNPEAEALIQEGIRGERKNNSLPVLWHRRWKRRQKR